MFIWLFERKSKAFWIDAMQFKQKEIYLKQYKTRNWFSTRKTHVVVFMSKLMLCFINLQIVFIFTFTTAANLNEPSVSFWIGIC